jgi:hypothetical protein
VGHGERRGVSMPGEQPAKVVRAHAERAYGPEKRPSKRESRVRSARPHRSGSSMPSLVAPRQASDLPFSDPTLLLRCGDASGCAALQRARVPHRAARGRAVRPGCDRWGHHRRRHRLRRSSPRPERGLARGGRLRHGHLEPLLEVRPWGHALPRARRRRHGPFHGA